MTVLSVGLSLYKLVNMTLWPCSPAHAGMYSMAQRALITWFLFTVISDFLPFLIKVHELGHVIAQGHSTHLAGRVRLPIQKQYWHWGMEQVATITCKCTASRPKFDFTNYRNSEFYNSIYSREMGLYSFLCCRFRDWTHKQSVSGLRTEWRISKVSNT